MTPIPPYDPERLAAVLGALTEPVAHDNVATWRQRLSRTKARRNLMVVVAPHLHDAHVTMPVAGVDWHRP